MHFNTVYTHDRAISATFATINNEPSLTQQSDAQDLDINVIMAKHAVTGQVPQLVTGASYGDFSQVTDYRDALTQLKESQDLFMQVPARIRAQFGNDPSEFFKFVNNPENQDEIYKMGLATRPDPAKESAAETAARQQHVEQPPQPTPTPPTAPTPTPTPNGRK